MTSKIRPIEVYVDGARWTGIEAFQYPAGEWSLRGEFPIKGRIAIVVRGCALEDIVLARLFQIRCTDVTRHAPNLVLPYVHAARADKARFDDVWVYGTLFNCDAVAWQSVHVFDVHSEQGFRYLLHAINSSITFRHESRDAVAQAFQGKELHGIIAPDAGAAYRANEAAMAMALPLYTATKTRDQATGKLSNFSCEALSKHGNYLVVDDICDGGGTFRGLAEATGLPRSQLSLWVSHGVFSGRANELNEFYGDIATTDSYPSLQDIGARVLPVLDFMPGAL